MSQKQSILAYLKKAKKGITPIQALSKFDCMCLSERIRDLRNDGHKIDTIMVESNNKKFARYVLV